MPVVEHQAFIDLYTLIHRRVTVSTRTISTPRYPSVLILQPKILFIFLRYITPYISADLTDIRTPFIILLPPFPHPSTDSAPSSSHSSAPRPGPHPSAPAHPAQNSARRSRTPGTPSITCGNRLPPRAAARGCAGPRRRRWASGS